MRNERFGMGPDDWDSLAFCPECESVEGGDKEAYVDIYGNVFTPDEVAEMESENLVTIET